MAEATRTANRLGLAVALTRETGARGGDVARRVGRLLGWTVYTQDVLEMLAQDGGARASLDGELPPWAARWADERLSELTESAVFRGDAAAAEVLRVTLALAAGGEAVFVGRGAGFALPPEAVLHVRLVAPPEARIAYVAQQQRLTADEAAHFVAQCDVRRSAFLAAAFPGHAADIYRYDLTVNTGLLGEEGAADVIAQAVRAKLEARERVGDAEDAPEYPE